MGGFARSGLLGSGRASMLPLGTLSLGLWVIAVDPAFIADQQSIKNCGIWIDQLDHFPAVMTMSFFLIFSDHPRDKPRTNLPHLQFHANNCVHSSHTDIKLCTYCFYRHTTVLIHEILFLVNQLWCIDFLTPPTPLIIPHRLPAFLESLMPFKNWCSIHARCSKSSLKHSIRFCGIVFSKFKTQFYCISFCISSKFNSIWPIGRTLSGATIPGQSGPGSDGNEEVLRIPQSPSITGTSPSDCLVSYWGDSFLSVYSTVPTDWATKISRWLLSMKNSLTPRARN